MLANMTASWRDGKPRCAGITVKSAYPTLTGAPRPCLAFPRKGGQYCVSHELLFGRHLWHVVVDGPLTGLQVKVANTLRRAGLKSRARLVSMTDDELLKVRNLGQAGLNEVRAWLKAVPAQRDTWRCPICAESGCGCREALLLDGPDDEECWRT